MKKACIVLVFSILACFAFGKSVDSLDGNDWMTTSAPSKVAFVQGFLNSNSVTLYSFAKFYQALGGDHSLELKRLTDLLSYPQTVGDIITLLDNFYSNTENRHFNLGLTIPYLCGKGIQESVPKSD